jgi:tRNA G18 (ribose-2'-O)-methylase SpoU
MQAERPFDPSDPSLAWYRHLSDADLLRNHGLFVAEGRLVVRRVIESGRCALRSLLVNEAAFQSLAPLLETLSPAVPIHMCASSDFLGLTGYHIHRGCLALVERPEEQSLHAVLDRLAPQPLPAAGHIAAGAEASAGAAQTTTVVVLEGVTNADNVGGVFRNAAAFGADAVLLSPTCCDPLYRKAIRTSMAATLQVPYARVAEWPRGLEALRARGFSIAALSPRGPSVLHTDFAAARLPRTALLVGTEGDGLTADAEAAADVRVRIPISGAVDSLNLAVAVGIALHQLSVRRSSGARLE